MHVGSTSRRFRGSTLLSLPWPGGKTTVNSQVVWLDLHLYQRGEAVVNYGQSQIVLEPLRTSELHVFSCSLKEQVWKPASGRESQTELGFLHVKQFFCHGHLVKVKRTGWRTLRWSWQGPLVSCCKLWSLSHGTASVCFIIPFSPTIFPTLKMESVLHCIH